MKITEFDPLSPKYDDVESQDEAEALITTFPDSSKAWIFYMVYYLKQGEINKARNVAKRGIKTINFRKDEEKLNLWKGLMNLEARHGTSETLTSVFNEALEFNDKKSIHLHMMQLLLNTEKTDEIESFSEKLFKHFKSDKDIYITLCTHYMKTGKTKEARNLFNRSLQCVPSKEHSDVMGKFAHLEYKYGDLERSFNIYEELLVKYPKRKDLKSIYIQVLRSEEQTERADYLLHHS